MGYFSHLKLFVCLLTFLVLVANYSLAISFDRQYFGVTFSPFVKGSIDDDNKPYTLENVKTMLRVVSTRFSNVLVYDFPPIEGQ